MKAADYEHLAAQLDADIDRMDALVGTPETEPADPRYKLWSGASIAALPWPTWRIRNVMPAEGVVAGYGASGSGKSFLFFDMGAAIAEERGTWFGYRVEGAPVVYAALEGEAGLRRRVQAWEIHHGRPLPERMLLMLQSFKLTDPKDVRDFAAVVAPGAVVFIDTLNRAAPNADENSSKDMGEILQGAKRLQGLIDGLVVLIHHTGKDASKGLRGHSSLFAAMDAAVEVTRDGDRRRWSVAKSKDAEDGTGRAFKLAVVELGLDEVGDLATSCVVTSDLAAEEIKRARLPQGGNQRIALDALRPHFRTGQLGRPGAPPLRPCIELQQSIILVAGHLTCDADRRAERARTAITGLVSRGVLGCSEGWLWLQ